MAFLLACVPVTAVGLLVALVSLPFDPHRHWVHAFNCRVSFGFLRLNPAWRIRFEHLDRLPEGPAVWVANHQSMADVFVMMGLRRRFKFVSKASLFALPFVGWMMHLARYVSLNRGSGRSAQRMLERCREWLRRGVPVVIFPEGTYGDGKRLLPFRRGAFRLAVSEKVPIVPIALHGTTEILEGDGPWLNPSAQVRVEVLEPVLPEPGLDERVLCQRVQDALAKALGRPVQLPKEEGCSS